MLVGNIPKNKKPKFQKEPIWTIVINDESQESKWEIVHTTESKNVRLHFVPNDNYSDEDVNINLTYVEFQDLIKFMKKLDSKYY